MSIAADFDGSIARIILSGEIDYSTRDDLQRETSRALAGEHGNHPFGVLLMDNENRILLRAENTVVMGRDCTGHAETNLMRLASQHYSFEKPESCILYTCTEPCAMCAGAIRWGNVRRVVYTLSETDLYDLVGEAPDHLLLPCHEVLCTTNVESKWRAPHWNSTLKPGQSMKASGPHNQAFV